MNSSSESMKKRVLILIGWVLAVAVLVVSVLAMLRTPDHIKGAQRLNHAYFAKSREAGTWQSIELPDGWDERLPGYGGFGWYRLHINLDDTPSKLWGIYMPRLSMNAEVYVNGVLSGSGGSMEEPVSRHWNLPLYLQIIPSTLKVGDNEILIRIRGYANGRSGLSPIFVGTDDALFPVYRTRLLHSHELSVGAFAVNMTLGLILLVWWYASKDRAFLWFAIGSILSCVYILDSFWVNTPLFRIDWRWLTHAAVACSISFYYLFMLRMLEHPVARLERTFLIYAFVGALLLRLADNAHQLPFALALHLGVLCMMIHLIWLSFSGWLKHSKHLHLWLGVCMLMVAAFGFADWIPVTFHIEKKTPYIYYLGPVAFSFAVSLVLLMRFLNALQTERNFANYLRTSLAEQEELLVQQHQRIAVLERERAVDDERTRIMRELHDGLGGHLVGALSISEKQGKDVSLHNNIRYALDELRIMMDSLDPDTDVLTMLGMLRMRIEPSLTQANTRLEWDIRCRPENMPNSAESSLNVMRIVQEAITNSVRHAYSDRIIFRMTHSGFCIVDNGNGFHKEVVSHGRGLNNMEWRCTQLGAVLKIRSSKSGTIVKVYFPERSSEKTF
jgi:signal transduction histidine kinase